MFDPSTFFAGLIGGGVGTLMGHPLDTLKTRLQVGRIVSPGGPKSFYSAVKDLYRGVGPPILTVGIIQSINFSVYEATKRYLIDVFPKNYSDEKTIYPFDPLVTSGGGFAAGCVVSLIACPITVVKINQQVGVAGAQSSNSIRDVSRFIFSNGGWKGFYRGYATTLMLEAPGRGMYMTMYEFGKMSLMTYGPDFDNDSSPWISRDSFVSSKYGGQFSDGNGAQPSLLTRILAAGISGIFSWLPVFPLDVVRSRMQADTGTYVTNHSNSNHGVAVDRIKVYKYKSSWDCGIQVYQQGGLRAFTRGLGYTLMRAFPVAATMLTVYEVARIQLAQY